MAAAFRCLAAKLPRAADFFVVPSVTKFQTQIRNASVNASTKLEDIDESKLPEFEISKNPQEWSFVERCFPLATVPELKKFEGPTPSGWVPPRDEGKTHPYFCPRNKNHMMQVYLHISYRGSRHVTVIRKIQGDIWQMEKDLTKYLKSKCTKKYYKEIASRVNEMSGQIRIRGDYVSHVKAWMESKGF